LHLRLKGYDIKTVKDVERKGISDIDQLKYATSDRDNCQSSIKITFFYKPEKFTEQYNLVERLDN
jgi:hypothetical protein